jgi:large subunit ribosomal protein L23
MKSNYDVIIRPVLSEKTYDEINDKRYAFYVHPKSNKTEIKLAVEKIFGVKVEKVNTVHVLGKFKRQGRYEGYTSERKKAYVILKADSKPIEFFEGMA